LSQKADNLIKIDRINTEFKFIDHELPDQRGNDILIKYKRKLLEEMNERYLEVSRRGISNQRVISDLVISEHTDVKKEYNEFYVAETASQRTRKNVIMNVVGSLLYILAIIILFLGVSFMYRSMGLNVWGKSWLIVVDGILLWAAYLLNLGVKKLTSLRRIFHIFARIALALEVMVITVAVFLFTLVMIGFAKSWVIVIAGIAAMFVADAVYASVTKRKLAIINYLLYVPAVATMLYIILSAVGVLVWNTGWMIIIFSLVLDFIIMYASFARNKHYKQEVVDTWKEN
ncbi:MAG: hypothetical protein K2K01_02740, partial [Eubacterium sp.]|nr:hypothetical protein [Eubacterium sp.]